MTAKIKFNGDFKQIDDSEKEFIDGKIDKFVSKHSSSFSDIHIKLDCHVHKEKSKGKHAFACKIRTSSGEGDFNSENQDFGAGKSVVGALDKIERQIKKSTYNR